MATPIMPWIFWGFFQVTVLHPPRAFFRHIAKANGKLHCTLRNSKHLRLLHLTSPLTLTHNDATHEDLDRPDSLQGNLALSCSLPHTKLMSKLLLAYRVWMIDFVPEDHKWHLTQLFHRKKRIELSFWLGKALVIFCVDEKYDPWYLREVIFPQTAG